MTSAGTTATLLIIAICCLTGTAAANASYAEPATVCEDESQQLVMLLENGNQESDDPAVFVGTEMRLASDSTDDGGNPVERRDFDASDASTLTVVATNGTDTNSSIHGIDVQFNNASNREAFDDAHEQYVSAVDDAASLTSEFANAAEADDPASALDRATVATIDDRVAAVDENSTRIETLLVQAAGNDSDVAAAYFEQRDDRAEATADLKSAADDYVAAVESQASDARLLLTALLLGPFVAGTFVGVMGGRAISRRDLKQVRRERRRDRTVEYGLGNLWKVLVGGAVAVLVGITVIVAGTGFGDILAVIA